MTKENGTEYWETKKYFTNPNKSDIGDIYKYTVLGEYNEIIVDSLLDTVNKLVYNRDTIKDYDKLLTRTLTQLKENNVVLEVFLWE